MRKSFCGKAITLVAAWWALFLLFLYKTRLQGYAQDHMQVNTITGVQNMSHENGLLNHGTYCPEN